MSLQLTLGREGESEMEQKDGAQPTEQQQRQKAIVSRELSDFVSGESKFASGI